MIKELEFKNHDEWLNIRHKYIGGSDAAAVVGMNPYKSRYSLWAEKTNKIAPFEGNVITKVGAYLEQLVADMFEEETGKKVRKKNRTMVNDEYPFACANVDRLIVGEKAFLEIKTTNSIPLMKRLRNSNEFPDAYYCQVIHYMAVTGLKKAYLAVLINCRELKIYELERDENEIKALMKAEKEFFELIKTNTPPDPDGEASTTSAISEMYPTSNNDEVVSIQGYENFLKEYIDLSTQIKALTGLKDSMANKVKEFMKGSARAESNKYKVSWVSNERKTFDTKKFISDHPNMDLSNYYKTSLTRTFRVNER